ncbi:MAG: shikimate kinase [Clostridia bacterium]|nr:shikimate kinase [Clostridia bacterium]
MKQGYKHMRCGLLGEHLGHSFSPQIHASIADYTYDLVELSPEEVGNFVKNGGLDAFNVTIPYKKTVMPFLDTIAPEAQRIGSVNTVVRRPDGRIDGYNTDYFGFDGMLTASSIDVRGAKVLVLGNGGASLTVCAVLRDRGAGEILVFDLEGPNTYDTLPLHTDAEVIVNATPVGMYPKNGASLVELSEFPKCRGVLDVIYNPARTALLLDAERHGIPHMNGLYMLVAQAVKAFEFFTGDSAEDGIIEAITREIAAQTRNIILIGMPGCGKSTVGKTLAQNTGRPFYDADNEFTTMHGITPADAIKTLGEDRFREMEHETLCALGKMSGAVIACGGGVVTREYNYDPLHQNGVILYLERELSRLATDGRPLSQRTSPEALYAARKDAYERFADLRIQSTEVVEKTAEAMLAALASYPN